MNKKRTILIILLIIHSLVIFAFSQQNGVKSASMSDAVASKMIENYEKVSNKDLGENKKKEFINNTRFLIRKTAHFTEYFYLGILVYMTLKSFNVKRPFIFSLSLSFGYAITDEIHQLFSAGRSARIFDVAIDTLGSLTGIILLILVIKFVEHLKSKRCVKARVKEDSES